MTRYDIDYLLDKYRIRDMLRSISENYVDAADMLSFSDTRDEACYKYASAKFNASKRPQYKEMSLTARRYLAVLKGENSITKTIHSKDELEECIEFLWNYVLPYSDEDYTDDISTLVKNNSFLRKYKLTDVISYL